MRKYHQLPRPQRRREDQKRTIDEFYEEAISYRFNPVNYNEEAIDNDTGSGVSLPDIPSRPRPSLWDCNYIFCPSLQYYIILIALGLANAGDATEISSLNFCLSDQVFSDQILHDDFKGRGATISAAIFLGMLIGGLLVSCFLA